MSSYKPDDTNKSAKEIAAEFLNIINPRGYNLIEEDFLKTKKGLFFLTFALLRLDDIFTDRELIDFTTKKLIDKTELYISPRKILLDSSDNLRSDIDEEANKYLNETIEGCRTVYQKINHGNISLKKMKEDILYLNKKGKKAFKRVVALKTPDFGGGYLLDEDIHKNFLNFTETYKEYYEFVKKSLGSNDALNKAFSTVEAKLHYGNKSSLTSSDLATTFHDSHITVISLIKKFRAETNRRIEMDTRGLDTAENAISTYLEQVNSYNRTNNENYNPESFQEIRQFISSLKEIYITTLKKMKYEMERLLQEYTELRPEKIKYSRPSVHPDYIVDVASRQGSALLNFVTSLDKMFKRRFPEYTALVDRKVESFYPWLNQLREKNPSFDEAVKRCIIINKYLNDTTLAKTDSKKEPDSPQEQEGET
ncbi:MAG: hypothetical protein ACOCSE_03680 [Chitinivibrionales bacterium]